MGTMYGVRLEYNPFWEEKEHQAYMSEGSQLYCAGYDDGYAAGSQYFERTGKEFERLEKENATLKGLLAANVRVIKQEIIKEQQQEEKKEADNVQQEDCNSSSPSASASGDD